MPSLGYISYAVLALTVAFITPSEAAFRWPWEAQHHVHRHQLKSVPEPLNCDRINESVKILEPKNLARALHESTAKQRETIDNCAKGAQP
jgi:hypothetical protein